MHDFNGLLYNKLMHIVLSHEQADFDAVASLLAVYLLDKQALAILPKRINRNVRAFLTLYGSELPFIELEDLPRGAIAKVTLVDTQSMISLKGLNKHTHYSVVDHHPQKEDLDTSWQVLIDNTGANTTLLIENLQEKNQFISSVEATLLLLGIYEDTGALTYSRTTGRDASAAAYLLEQGANLQLVRDFLNHPLSLDQQRIYQQLVQGIENLSIKGAEILLAEGQVEQRSEELSSIAHKIRDNYDPDALVLLVRTAAGLQLVARATSDQVDVGALARSFGGGGHKRAAAALIQETNTADIKQALISRLPEYIFPLVTVAEIMSRGPQVISPETPVAEVAEKMQRYGYEGYPVVGPQGVVGLIDRRAVDRTLSHKLKLKVKDVMSPGSVHIYPDDSIESLQRLMTETAWGQIPVLHRDTQAVIGIVTRTDLLKILNPEKKRNQQRNYSEQLERLLSPSRLALLKATAQTAETLNLALYIVGGFVRDLILERASQDFDLVVEGDAIALARALANRYGGRVTTHKRFGTAKWSLLEIKESLAKVFSQTSGAHIKPEDFPDFLDLVSARREFYTAPTALPVVERGSIKLDLHRRDFTINTLALRLDGSQFGQLLDYWGGMQDLKNGTVRVLHSLSFVDDPTRILRAIRFEQRFGYQIEARTLELLDSALVLLSRVSGDRLRHELNTILQEEHALKILERLGHLGVLTAIHPALSYQAELAKWLAMSRNTHPEPVWRLKHLSEHYPLALTLLYLFWFQSFSPSEIASVAKRLRLPAWLKKLIEQTRQLVEQTGQLNVASPGEATLILDQAEDMAIFAYAALCDEQSIQEKIGRYKHQWQQLKPGIRGDKLKDMQIKPGPQYHQLLSALRIAWINGEIKDSEEEEIYFQNLLKALKEKQED